MCDITEQSSEYQQSEGEELSAPLLQQPISENGSEDEEGEICAETPVMKHLMQIIHIYSDQSGNFLNITKGLSIMFIFGALLGLVMPNNSDLPNPWYQTFSSVIGYIYFVSWSVSFYPQIITNYQRKHITGLSTDASILAVLNYTCYAIYNVFFYFDDTIRNEYKNRHGEDAKITVQSNDVMFSIHALFLTGILLAQIIYYGGFRSNPISKITVLIVALVLLSAFAYMACIYTKGWLWIDFLYLLATFKLILTVLTYIPQVILNYWRQSTTGWNVWNVIFDFTGGILSLFQLILDSVDLHDLRHGILGNCWAKLVLSLITLGFDTVFLCQHYMYSDENVDEEEGSDIYDLLEESQ